jgi:hypothetical protein
MAILRNKIGRAREGLVRPSDVALLSDRRQKCISQMTKRQHANEKMSVR